MSTQVNEPVNYRNQAAVLVLSCGSAKRRQVLLTERAAHLAQHPGEVAFPGGKWEPQDQDLLHTALRETEEEVGISAAQVQVCGQLPASYTLRGQKVTPYVGEVRQGVLTRLDHNELASLFWLPVEDLLADQRLRTDVFHFRGRDYWSPAYRCGDHVIWGFTARVLVQWANQYAQGAIGREHPSAPEHFIPER